MRIAHSTPALVQVLADEISFTDAWLANVDAKNTDPYNVAVAAMHIDGLAECGELIS